MTAALAATPTREWKAATVCGSDVSSTLSPMYFPAIPLAPMRPAILADVAKSGWRWPLQSAIDGSIDDREKFEANTLNSNATLGTARGKGSGSRVDLQEVPAHQTGGVECHGSRRGDAVQVVILGLVVRSLEHVEHFLRGDESA